MLPLRWVDDEERKPNGKVSVYSSRVRKGKPGKKGMSSDKKEAKAGRYPRRFNMEAVSRPRRACIICSHRRGLVAAVFRETSGFSMVWSGVFVPTAIVQTGLF